MDSVRVGVSWNGSGLNYITDKKMIALNGEKRAQNAKNLPLGAVFYRWGKKVLKCQRNLLYFIYLEAKNNEKFTNIRNLAQTQKNNTQKNNYNEKLLVIDIIRWIKNKYYKSVTKTM